MLINCGGYAYNLSQVVKIGVSKNSEYHVLRLYFSKAENDVGDEMFLYVPQKRNHKVIYQEDILNKFGELQNAVGLCDVSELEELLTV